jgi:hypothetical protein
MSIGAPIKEISPGLDGSGESGGVVPTTADVEIKGRGSSDGSSREGRNSESLGPNGSDSKGAKAAYPSSVWEALMKEEVCVCALSIFLGLAIIDSCHSSICDMAYVACTCALAHIKIFHKHAISFKVRAYISPPFCLFSRNLRTMRMMSHGTASTNPRNCKTMAGILAGRFCR